MIVNVTRSNPAVSRSEVSPINRDLARTRSSGVNNRGVTSRGVTGWPPPSLALRYSIAKTALPPGDNVCVTGLGSGVSKPSTSPHVSV